MKKSFYILSLFIICLGGLFMANGTLKNATIIEKTQKQDIQSVDKTSFLNISMPQQIMHLNVSRKRWTKGSLPVKRQCMALTRQYAKLVLRKRGDYKSLQPE